MMGTWLMIATCLLAVAVVSLAPWGALVAGRRLSVDAGLYFRLGALWVGAVLLSTGVLAGAGILQDFDSWPPPMMPLLLGVTALTIFVASSRLGSLLSCGLPLWALVGFQVFRLPVELILFGLFLDGKIPQRMTLEGYNLDVLTALSAPVVAYLLYQNKAGARLAIIWNIAGLLLLLNIVTISILSAPLPISVFTEGTKNTMIAALPFVWIPTIFVQAALFGHLMVFRALRAAQRRDFAPPAHPLKR